MRIALALLCLAPLVAAAPDTTGPITEKDLLPHIKRLEEMVQQVREGKIKIEQLRQYYAANAVDEAPAREKAIHAYMYGYVLSEVLDADRDEARKQYKRALKLWPRFSSAHVALATLAANDESFREADKQIRMALKVEPGCVAAWLLRAQIAMHRERFGRAEECYKRSIEEDPTGKAFAGLATVYVKQHRGSFDDEERKEWAQKAVNAVDNWIFMEPEDDLAHLVRAEVCLQLGRIEDAIGTLEKAVARPDVKERAQRAYLGKLRAVYAAMGDLEGLKKTLKRMRPLVDGDQREHVDQRLEDIDEKGRAALVIWKVERELEILENDGIDVDKRRLALERLLAFYANDDILTSPHLREYGWKVIQKSFRVVLIDAPPELVTDFLKFLRKMFPDPKLVRILVHFIYPYANERTTPNVRVEAVRTLAVCAKEASLPALLFSLRDDSGAVLREVDRALSDLCQRRSPVGGGIGPLKEREIKRARKTWMKWARSEDGAAQLADAFEKLGKIAETDPNQTRGLTAAPLVVQTVELVLLDNDMPWAAWKPAYDFLRSYWGKDFRPSERRELPVEEFERAHVVKEIDEFWKKAKTENSEKPPPAPAVDEASK